MSSRRGSSTQVADSVPFDSTGKAYRSDNLDEVAVELRQKLILEPEYITSTLNGTLALTSSDKTLQIINGSATGYTVQLPDATTLFNGEIYESVNLTGEQLTIKDNDGTLLLTLNPGDITTSTLEDNSTTAGNWFQIVTSATAKGITSYTLETATLFSTTSMTDTVITGFTVTPLSGRYSVFYSADIEIGSNNRKAHCVLYKGGVVEEPTRRIVQGVSNTFVANQQTIGVITVNGSEAIDVRVRITNGDLDIVGRTLVLIRLGT